MKHFYKNTAKYYRWGIMKIKSDLKNLEHKNTENEEQSLEFFINTHYRFKCNSQYKGLFGKIRAYVDRIEVEETEQQNTQERYESTTIYGSDPFSEERREAILRRMIESSFSSYLIALINSKEKDCVEVYKKANIDRKLFSKIRTDKDYVPSKKTIISLALSLELSLEETQKLLKKAGFTLSHSILFDVIVEYFITQKNYNRFDINEELFKHKQKTLD